MNPRKGVPSVSNPLQESEVMTVSEVAAYLNCHPGTVYRLLEGGELPAFRLGGDWRFLRSEVDKWIAARHVRPHAPAKPSDKKRKGLNNFIDRSQGVPGFQKVVCRGSA